MPSFQHEKQRVQELLRRFLSSRGPSLLDSSLHSQWLRLQETALNSQGWRDFKGHLQGLVPRAWHIYLEQPRWLGQFIEQKHPRLAKQFLSVASIGLGFEMIGLSLGIDTWEETLVEVSLLPRWKSLPRYSELHVGALLTLAELTSRLFWERHLDPQLTRLRVVNLESQFIRSAKPPVRAVFKMSESEREAFLFRLRAEHQLQLAHEVLLYDNKEHLVAQVTVHWDLRTDPVLNSRDLRS